MDFRQVFGHESQQVDGLSRTRHWALGAVIAALCTFAYAKVPSVPHGGGAGYSRAPIDHAMHNSGRYYGAPPARPARDPMAERSARVPRGGPNFAGGNYGNRFNGNGFNAYNPGMRRVAGPAGYPGNERGSGMQYAGAITPVSAESRAVPRPPANAQARATGSIRADVARYNEERGTSRAMPRQSDDSRPPESAPYRN
ncbi:hypothetical protein [Paraburkholderia ginsengiterrae]|uniref:hypothetical protein n=1 Tax=Paraburkholderia ginsengiterrae TaxID=1462993 RepID=UPI001F614E8D|nr:hypothetical protein [Paraburkholderia ginsengiterrae]